MTSNRRDDDGDGLLTDGHKVQVFFPEAVYRRIKRLARERGQKVAHFLREAATAHAEALEKQRDEREAQRLADERAKRDRRAARLGSIAMTSSKPSTLSPRDEDDDGRTSRDHLDDLYDDLAGMIARMPSDDAARQRADQAVEEVHRRHPLLAPDRDTVRAILERRVMDLSRRATTREYDDLVGTETDVSRVKTFHSDPARRGRR